jgi:hypothetical protein
MMPADFHKRLQTVACIYEENLFEVALGKLLGSREMDTLRFASEAESDEIFFFKDGVMADLGDQFRWKRREGGWRIHDGGLLDSFGCLLRVEKRFLLLHISIVDQD